MKKIEDAMNKTSWGWIVALGMVPMLIAGCDRPKSETTNTVADLYVYTDRQTGCQYVTEGRGLTPRIAADGRSHMGCKGAQP